jgi:hypothetical protein
VKSVADGNITRFFAYCFIFGFLWIEVRGLKKEMAKLNQTISKSFHEGEARFEVIEFRIAKMEEQFLKGELING